MSDQLTVEQQAMLAVWQQHTYAEFVLKDPDGAIATMTENPYVILVPAGTGGVGREGVRDFYANHFLPNIPRTWRSSPFLKSLVKTGWWKREWPVLRTT
jgi:hypothetical protein